MPSVYVSKSIFDRICSWSKPTNSTESMRDRIDDEDFNGLPNPSWKRPKQKQMYVTIRRLQPADWNLQRSQNQQRLVFTPSPVGLGCHWFLRPANGRSPSQTALFFYFLKSPSFQFSANTKKETWLARFTLHFCQHVNFFAILNQTNWLDSKLNCYWPAASLSRRGLTAAVFQWKLFKRRPESLHDSVDFLEKKLKSKEKCLCDKVITSFLFFVLFFFCFFFCY